MIAIGGGKEKIEMSERKNEMQMVTERLLAKDAHAVCAIEFFTEGGNSL